MITDFDDNGNDDNISDDDNNNDDDDNEIDNDDNDNLILSAIKQIFAFSCITWPLQMCCWLSHILHLR